LAEHTLTYINMMNWRWYFHWACQTAWLDSTNEWL